MNDATNKDHLNEAGGTAIWKNMEELELPEEWEPEPNTEEEFSKHIVINRDLFLAMDHNWSEAARTAYEKLKAQPFLEEEPSVQLFVEELQSRIKLLIPILGSETEKFLGYSARDIVCLADFFAQNFNGKKFGMEAVGVQKILRNIWLRTPPCDARLTYRLYRTVDDKFYSIVDAHKQDVSFDHIPPVTEKTWKALRTDWEARRAHYANCLGIDIDYLDGEAVDSTIFPSASGLFASPMPSPSLEFLNYLMPHEVASRNNDANPNDFKREISTIACRDGSERIFYRTAFDHEILAVTYKYIVDTISSEEMPSWFHPYMDYFREGQLHYQQGWYKDNKFAFWEFLQKKLACAIDNGALGDIPDFWCHSRTIFCESIRSIYNLLLPMVQHDVRAVDPPSGIYMLDEDGDGFVVLKPDGSATFCSFAEAGWDEDGTVVYGHLDELPRFVNSCDDYAGVGGVYTLFKGSNLEFYAKNEAICKVYLPNLDYVELFAYYDSVFSELWAAQIVPASSNMKELLGKHQFYRAKLQVRFHHHFLRRFHHQDTKEVSESKWIKKVDAFIEAEEKKVIELVKQYFDQIEQSSLSAHNKIALLEFIRDFLYPATSEAGEKKVIELVKQYFHRVEQSDPFAQNRRALLKYINDSLPPVTSGEGSHHKDALKEFMDQAIGRIRRENNFPEIEACKNASSMSYGWDVDFAEREQIYDADMERKRLERESQLMATKFAQTIDRIIHEDKLEQEQANLKRELRDAEVAGEERRKVLFEMSHSIKNLVASISEPLEILQKQLTDSPQRRTIGNALAGTGLIRDLAMGVHMSLRGEVGAWRKDVLEPDFGAITLDTILLKALQHAVSNMFDGKYFAQFVRNYFARDLQTFMQAEAEWSSADTAQQVFACINRYFLDFTLDSHGADLKIPVGDRDGTATKLLILFQELLLNAVKYSSLVERPTRFLKIDISVTPGIWDVTISNSAVESKTTKSAGLGLSVIKNFATLFEAAYHYTFKDGIYSVNLKFFLNK